MQLFSGIMKPKKLHTWENYKICRRDTDRRERDPLLAAGQAKLPGKNQTPGVITCLVGQNISIWFNIKEVVPASKGKKQRAGPKWSNVKVFGRSVLHDNQIILKLTKVTCKWTPTFKAFCNCAKRMAQRQESEHMSILCTPEKTWSYSQVLLLTGAESPRTLCCTVLNLIFLVVF